MNRLAARLSALRRYLAAGEGAVPSMLWPCGIAETLVGGTIDLPAPLTGRAAPYRPSLV